MDLMDIIHRSEIPEPWAEGEKIPWDEPGFSRRMLDEHLSQKHDAASRRFEVIEQHVDWIHEHVLQSQPSQILDLGCGPGLYARRLAQKGHSVNGIDFSPASIEYARRSAGENTCSYVQADIRKADYGHENDLIMLIYGEFNVFRPKDARQILDHAYTSLSSGGLLLLEVHTFEAVENMGRAPSGWSAASKGLFSERPHLLLNENFWDPEQTVATERYYLVDAETSDVSRFAASIQAYTEAQYHSLLVEAGFTSVTVYSSLHGEIVPDQKDFFVLLAKRP